MSQTFLPLQRPSEAPTVTVFGAGVAGLTVAHELVERGFVVSVVEPTMSLDIDGDCEVGGLARSQYSHVPLPEKQEWREQSGRMQTAKPVIRIPQHIYFSLDHGDTASDYDPDHVLRPQLLDALVHDTYALPNKVKLKEVAKALCDGAIIYSDIHRHGGIERCPTCASCKECKPYASCERCSTCLREADCRGWNIAVDVVGHCNADPGPVAARVAGKRRADSVIEALQPLIDDCGSEAPVSPSALIELLPQSMGSYRPLVDESTDFGRKLNSRVDFRILEVRLPGEHGYRFFPRFYRHLDDVMKRTPIYDADGHETRFTVYDNLEALAQTALAFADAEPQVAVLRRRPASFEEALSRFDEIRRALKATPEDLGLSLLKFVRYMTTSSERRKAECEDISWWDFLEGPRYSEAMQRYLRATPQAMVAMSVTTSDARTNGNATVQLLIDQMTDGSQVDRTLNGPTSEAWLRHWKEYLRRQGVVFYLGRLVRIEVDDVGKERRLKPVVEGVREHASDSDERAPALLRAIDEKPLRIELDGHAGHHDFTEDDYYVLALPPTKSKEALQGVDDDDLNNTFRTLKNYDFSGALGSMVGIQFYFRNNFKFFPGHTFFVDSAWRLTSISQLQFWREKRNMDNGYLGVLSVDIGNMHKRDTSQTRLLAFESQWHARQAAAVSVTDDEKKRCALASAAGEAAVAMRLVLPIEASPEQRDVLDKIRQLPWLLRLLELADAVPSDLTPVPPDVQQPTDRVLHSIIKLAAHQPEPIGASLKAGAEAILSVPFEDRKLPLPNGDNGNRGDDGNGYGDHEHADDGGGGDDLLGIAQGDIAMHRQYTVGDRPLEEMEEPDLYNVVHAGALAIAAATLASGGKTAWKSTRNQIARTTWRQIKLGLDYDVARTLPDPIFYWIDDTLEFDDEDLPKENHSPLLCELTGKFDGRPGPLPNTPGKMDSIYYEVCRKQWVLTGMITKTYTRITTMELCCESGRHAANAILHSIEHPDTMLTGDWIGTRIGDYCEIWDMEENEIDDLAPMKRVDARLLAEGLPHWIDILGVEPLVEQMLSSSQNAQPYHRVMSLWDAMRGIGQDQMRATGFEHPIWTRQREMLERIYGPEAGRVIGQLAERWLRRVMNRGPTIDPVDPVEWLFRLFYPRHDESSHDALRELFRDWSDFVEKYLLKGGHHHP